MSSYVLGVDVGGTFTDLVLVNDESGKLHTAKVPSTPEDPSIAVMNGIEKITNTHGISAAGIRKVMHGTTVATNAVLTRNGVKVGLVVTKGHRHMLHIGRSFVPGNLGAWVIWQKPDELVLLENVVEVSERVNARGELEQAIDEKELYESFKALVDSDIEALTVCLLNSYTNGVNEQRVKEIAKEILPNIPISLSSEVVPEMYEYERAVTTVVNSYVAPLVKVYVDNLKDNLERKSNNVILQILRSDGGLASAHAAIDSPVNLLMSGPAGGVSGAIWVAEQAGLNNILTFDMGGTSTDVALVLEGVAKTRRETSVEEVVVRAPSIDVRTVGAGGGSIAYVPELTKSLRVGPQSAGSVPGPAAYMKGGEKPTVTDANVVLGYLPSNAKLGGDMEISKELAEKAIATLAAPLGISLQEAAEGIYNIANENMFGALRLVSVEQGYDPRDFALMGFGGAGPIHANALGILLNAWPVIIPPGPGVLCAYGDATTSSRNEASKSYIKRFDQVDIQDLLTTLDALKDSALGEMLIKGSELKAKEVEFQFDVRYCGQGTTLTIESKTDEIDDKLLSLIRDRFDRMHEQLFVFSMDTQCEFVTLRAIVKGEAATVKAGSLLPGDNNVLRAKYDKSEIYYQGSHVNAGVYDRALLKAGDKVYGPAIITEMDSTSLILPGHVGEVDPRGCILIRPEA